MKIETMRFAHVPVDAVMVDCSYQRPTDGNQVKDIAGAFEAGAVKAVSLSERADGSLWCYDGAHTVAAARAAGWATVPALIVQGDPEREARWFGAINGKSRRVSQRDAQRAGVVARHPVALLVNALMSANGIVSQGGGQARPGRTNAVGLLRTLARRDAEGLTAAMDVIRALWAAEPLAWSGRVIRGVYDASKQAGADELRAGLKAHKVTPQRIEDAISVLGDAGKQSGWTSAGAVVLKLAGCAKC